MGSPGARITIVSKNSLKLEKYQILDKYQISGKCQVSDRYQIPDKYQ